MVPGPEDDELFRKCNEIILESAALRKKSREIQDEHAGILKRVQASDRKMESAMKELKKKRRNRDKRVA